jgi:membrane protein YqaA with SNARE-associated domain
MKYLIFIGMTIGSIVGWWLGEQISDDITWPLLISSVGTIAGVIGGWWIGRKVEQ